MNKKELLHHCKVFKQGNVDVGQLIYDEGLDVKTLRKTHAAILLTSYSFYHSIEESAEKKTE